MKTQMQRYIDGTRNTHRSGPTLTGTHTQRRACLMGPHTRTCGFSFAQTHSCGPKGLAVLNHCPTGLGKCGANLSQGAVGSTSLLQLYLGVCALHEMLRQRDSPLQPPNLTPSLDHGPQCQGAVTCCSQAVALPVSPGGPDTWAGLDVGAGDRAGEHFRMGCLRGRHGPPGSTLVPCGLAGHLCRSRGSERKPR